MKKETENKVEVVIVGLGITGLSCARFLASKGISFAVTDTRDIPPGVDELKEISAEIKTDFGGLNSDFIVQGKQCLLSPGVSVEQPAIQQVKEQGVEILGDIELFARYANSPVIAITGSNGKSTVTTLVYEMGKACGLNVKAGGNLGIPALDLIDTPEVDCYVLELSSFQLETTRSLQPVAATVLNISEDHMDRYDSIEAYAKSKQRIFNGANTVVLNADDPIVKSMAESDKNTCWFSLAEPEGNALGLIKTQNETWLALGQKKLISTADMKIQGSHNFSNALAAFALGKAAGFDQKIMLEVIKNFAGLEHRCQWVASENGITWYNDSKGTNEGATCAAITGLGEQGLIILIAGGDAKGAQFDDLASVMKGNVKRVILIGRDASLLEKRLAGKTRISHAKDMRNAVQIANDFADSGDIVLLSPACASLDMYKNYQARGDAFVEAVNAVLAS